MFSLFDEFEKGSAIVNQQSARTRCTNLDQTRAVIEKNYLLPAETLTSH